MGLLLLLALSLLLTTVAAIREAPQSSCSSQFNAAHHVTTTSGGGIHLPLHHPRSPCSPAPLPPLPFSTILLHDSHRAHSLASRLRKKPHSSPSGSHSSSSSISSPLSSGSSIGVGNYITKINLGTPPSPFVMVVDTGSSLSWLQCSPCNVSCHDQVGPFFNPSSSSTYHPLPCSSPECRSLPSATLNPSACSPSNVCVYEATYGDSSFSVGFLGRDTLSLSSSPSSSLPNFVYGCGQDNEGLFGRSAGLLGLAKNHLSLLSQLQSKSFSYCLPTSSSPAGTLSLGPYNPSKFSFTPMLSNSLDPTLYFIKLVEITVAGVGLPVSASAYGASPTIIDSGTVVSRLPTEVYAALSEKVAAAMRGYKRAPAYSILDTCFVGSSGKGMRVPEVAMVFAGGAALRLPARNVMIDIEDEGIACLAFAEDARVGIVGNRQQQTFSVVYDVANAKIGFAAGGCG